MPLKIRRFAAHHQRWITAPLVPLGAAAAFATPAHAHAHAQNFLNDLRASGMPVMYEEKLSIPVDRAGRGDHRFG
jgi:hypothetical protein